MKNKIESFGVESIREHTHLDLFSLFIAQCGSGNIIEEIVSPKRLSGSAICLCLNGEGEVMIDSNIYSLKKNDMIVLFPQSIDRKSVV